ncbi:M23 family metallopeptidase [Cytobacillus sp. Hm23]
MQFIPENLKQVLSDRLKAGFISKPKCHVEVDRMTYIPGYTEEVVFHDSDFIKTVNKNVIGDGHNTLVNYIPATFPFSGKSWSGINKTYYKTSNYGVRWGTTHKGVDLASIGSASDIVSLWDGKVVAVDYQQDGAGYYVKVLHDDNTLTKYFHMQQGSIPVKIGQQVIAGQKLGVEGATGKVTGRHLHLEIWRHVDSGGNGGVHVDPVQFLDGSMKLLGEVVSGEAELTERGYPGEVILNEEFRSRSWDVNTIYDLLTPPSGVKYEDRPLGDGGFAPTWTFNFTEHSIPKLGFNISMPESGYLQINFSGNFSGSDGDFLQVYVNDELLYRSSAFNGMDKITTTPDIHLPKGEVRVDITFGYGGRYAASKLKQVSLHSIKAQTLDKTYEIQASNDTYSFNEQHGETINLEVGKFVYLDTLILPEVKQCEIHRSLDQEAAEAKLTLANPDGVMSPDYNPFYFPDLAAKNAQSSYSYILPGGFHIGVLSENTPIRIYMGYGHDDHRPIRTFTGLIDSVNVSGGDGTISVTARDMYKKIINTTLMRRKVYGSSDTSLSVTTKNVSIDSLSRRDQIYYWAHEKVKEFALPSDCAYFLLAIAWHETQFGTTGAGRDESGSFVLGYGVFDSGKEGKYAGIETQMHYGAKRIKDALSSRGFIPKSFNDVSYFWSGGDYGNYQWATDTGWPVGVWTAYKQVTTEKGKYQPPQLPSGEVSSDNTGERNVQWLKTAIIQDLIGEAGMYGWRSTFDDMLYPDSIVEESYVIELNPRKGTVIKALPAEQAIEGNRFEEVPIDSVPSTDGYLNPLVEPSGKTFHEFKYRIAEIIQELIKDTAYRSYCDRFGTYRLELLNFEGPVVTSFRDDENLISLSKTVDHTRSRSHIVVFDDGIKDSGDDLTDRSYASFIDKELLLELKGEVRTMTVNVPWATTDAMKREVAKKLFFQMKQMSRTLQASIPGNPALDILDRIKVVDRDTATSATYFIKSIRDSFDVESGYIQIIDLTWSTTDQLVQVPDIVINSEPSVEGQKEPQVNPPEAPEPPESSPENVKVHTFYPKGTRSWRDNWGWRSDNDWVYQGQWEEWGHHKGLMFFDFSAIQDRVKDQTIKKVRLYLERHKRHGMSSEQKPTFWLHNHSTASGNPGMVVNTNWISNVGWATGDKKWVTLPTYFGEGLQNGNAKGIGIYTDQQSPYIYFYGNSIKLEITTEG